MTVNFEKLVSDFSKIKIKANSDGLIPISNVLITKIPSNFYNIFSLKLLQSIIKSSYKVGESDVAIDLHSYAESLLENAAAECGFHTGCAVINSDEFEAVMGSSIEKQEDLLYGLFAVAVAWGWGDFEIVELIPNEKLVLRAYDYYESDIKDLLINDKHYFAYMLQGVSRAFMDIVYGHKCPSNRLGVFKSQQTKGIEMGDSYGEFVVTLDTQINPEFKS